MFQLIECILAGWRAIFAQQHHLESDLRPDYRRTDHYLRERERRVECFRNVYVQLPVQAQELVLFHYDAPQLLKHRGFQQQHLQPQRYAIVAHRTGNLVPPRRSRA